MQKKNILELLFSTCPELMTSCTTGPGISDHDHIVIARANLPVKQNMKKPRKIHLYKKTDWTAVKSFLKSAEEVFNQNLPHKNSVKDNWQFFKDTILQAIEKFVPTKRASGRYYLPWMARPIKRLLRQKQRAYKDRDWTLFRKLRKKSKSDLKTAHWNYLNTILTEDNNNKRLWRYLKGTRKDSCGVSTLASGEGVGTIPRDKAEMLNTQFSSVFTQENVGMCLLQSHHRSHRCLPYE